MKAIKNYLNEAVSSKGQWDTQDDMYKKGTIGNNVWTKMYEIQKKGGNPNLVMDLADYLADIFKTVEFAVTCPNTKEVKIIARKDTNILGELKGFDTDTIKLSDIQKFLDDISK